MNLVKKATGTAAATLLAVGVTMPGAVAANAEQHWTEGVFASNKSDCQDHLTKAVVKIIRDGMTYTGKTNCYLTDGSQPGDKYAYHGMAYGVQ